MSAREIRHRLVALVRRQLGWIRLIVRDRDDGWVARMVGHDASRAELPGYLARALATRVYGHDWTSACLARNLEAAGVAETIVREANELCAHRLSVLGYGVRDAGPSIDWHRDLVSGARWPRRYWGFMPNGLAQGWDPKIVWEPSRHQHFLVLAAAATLTADRRYADELADQLVGWLEQNPPLIGIHWLEALEPACRLLSWLWALPLVLDTPRFTADLCAAVLRSLVAQTRHVAANMSHYTSPNTHLIGEALALFVVGTVLPELEEARAWRERGRAILEREIVVQVGEDGLYREASLYYHAYAVEFYVVATVIAARNGVALAPVVRVRLQRMLEALAWLVRGDGTLPSIGDADGGRALRLGAPNLVRVHELLASGAALFERPELRAGLTASGAEAAWLWPDGLARLGRIGWAAPPRGTRHFADARLVVERRRVDGAERLMIFDVGDLGMLSGPHGHAGCLGLELHENGHPLLVDRGTYVYNVAPAWRGYFRGTRAHSTVRLDAADQAEPATSFQWATRYRSRILRYGATSEYLVVTGEHDGYGRLPAPVRHRRTLVSVGGEYWLCVDVLDGDGTHDAEFLFQLAPELEVALLEHGAFAVRAGGAPGLRIVPAGFAHARSAVVAGATDPVQGWHSEDYGEKRPAPTLITTEPVTTPAVRAHILAPHHGQAPGALAVESHRVDDGLVIVMRGPRFRDLVFCAPGARRRFQHAGLAFVGELLHARFTERGELRRSLAVGATSLRCQGTVRLESETVVDWAATVYEGTDARTVSAPGARGGSTADPNGRAGDALVTAEGD